MNASLRSELLEQKKILLRKIEVEESRHCRRVAAKYKRILEKLEEKLKEE